MIRLRTILAVTAVALSALALTTTSASAQDYPPQPPPPGTQAGCTVGVSFSGPVGPGVTVSITVTCGSITAGRSYTGILASTPVVLPTTVAGTDDQVTFSNVRLPNDFEVPGFHTLTIVDAQSGAALGSARFFVDGGGRIAAPPSGTGKNIPRTGSDLTGPALRIGAGLLAAGAGALVVSRRRRAAAGIAA